MLLSAHIRGVVLAGTDSNLKRVSATLAAFPRCGACRSALPAYTVPLDSQCYSRRISAVWCLPVCPAGIDPTLRESLLLSAHFRGVVLAGLPCRHRPYRKRVSATLGAFPRRGACRYALPVWCLPFEIVGTATHNRSGAFPLCPGLLGFGVRADNERDFEILATATHNRFIAYHIYIYTYIKPSQFKAKPKAVKKHMSSTPTT